MKESPFLKSQSRLVQQIKMIPFFRPFGEMSLFDTEQHPRSATARARNEATCDDKNCHSRPQLKQLLPQAFSTDRSSPLQQ